MATYMYNPWFQIIVQYLLFGPMYNHVYMQHKDHLTMHTINIFLIFVFYSLWCWNFLLYGYKKYSICKYLIFIFRYHDSYS